MYGSNRQCAEQYRKMSISTSITDANPHKLVAMLFDGVCQRIRQAQASMAQGDQARKGKAIGQACDIVSHLNGSLDHEAGGEIANNLSALYDYVMRQLTAANLHNDESALIESLELLSEIRAAWNAIPTQQREVATAAVA
ncbi:flagellar export chaperone FliS [Xanthomonas sp. MUS 060]|uniref:flagellar export chaperone FliS n=1 Tax=Xanthomonas sp. MUS 060 TaxID=1588031 RepID=UPI0005F2F170|nr:flagellar export chaperone FliS [Xanthomonas sp. MUS 060]